MKFIKIKPLNALFLFLGSIVAPVNMDAVSQPVNKELENIRICEHCMDMLECRRFLQYNQSLLPDICVLYEHLQKIKTELSLAIDTYYRVNL